jgi:hypothetical protein
MALQHLRSSTADKRPTPAAMSDGQLALNTNLASPGLFFKDSNGDSVKIGPVHIGTTAPNATPGAGGQAGNSKGEAWLDTTAANPILKVFNGSAFVAVQPVGTGTVVSTTDTGTVTSTMILDGTILNADINASAAIVDTKLATIATGGKVSGTAITSGNISTSGSFTSTSTVTGTNLIPTGSGVPTNGIYLPAANSVAVATNGTGRLFVDASGNVGINTASTIAPGGFGYAREFALTGATSGDSSISVNLRGSRTVPGGFADINFWHQSTANRAYIQARRGSSDSAIDLDFITSGGAGMRITSAGLVGVGTSSPGRSLEVFGSASSFARFNATGLLANGLDVGYSSAGYALINNQENTSLAFATNNTERLRITSAGLVGIGNSAPSKTLDVVGDAKIVKTASTQNILLGVSSGAIGYKTQIDFGHPTVGARIESERLGANTQSSLSFWTTSAAGATGRALTIDASQRVGIGTASPSAPLCVQGAANSDQLIVTGLNGLSRGLKISTGADYANDSLVKYDAQYASGSNYGAHAFLTGGQERLRLDRLGRLLVGTSSASYSSTIVCQGNSGSSSGEGIVRLNRGTAVPTSGQTLGAIIFGQSAGNDGAYILGEADAAWSASNDYPTRLVFSTTADGAGSPTERMRIGNDGILYNVSTSHAVIASTTQAAGLGYYLFVGRYGATAGTAGSGTNSIEIYSNGNVRNTNNSYTAISDLKLKENIVDANSQWNDIKALRVRNYNLKEGQTHKQIGLIAQEVEPISPGLVYETSDWDADNNDIGTTTKSVQYSVLYMKAVKALQEAMERIETLEGMVAVNNITIDEQQHQLSTLAARLTALESA